MNNILSVFRAMPEHQQEALLIDLIENYSTNGSWQENLDASEHETLKELCNDMFTESFASVAYGVAKNISGLD